MTTGCRISARARTFLLASILMTLGLPVAAAQEGVAAGGNQIDFPRELVLRPERVPYELERFDSNLGKTSGPFRKEPELSQDHVFRCVLQIGKDTNNAFALIWDQPKRKLYVDLTRNLDLTDDPGGVFSSTNKGFSQRFADITLPLKTAMDYHPVTLDLRLSADGTGSWVRSQLIASTLWQAKVTLGDEVWQVAVADRFLSSEVPAAAKFLLLRPWAVRTNQVWFDAPACGLVPFPERLFWLGRAFKLEQRFETGGQTPVCKLELTPQQPPLTELELSGEFLSYAVLRDTNGYAVVLLGAPGTIKLPQGVYTVAAVWLKKGVTEALRDGNPPAVVKATNTTRLVLGGPLTNWVTLERQGRKLAMNYQLKGADGESYRLARQDREKPPEFTVYRGGKKVLADKFQFG